MYVCCRKNVVSSCSSNQVRIEVVYSFVNSMQFSGNQYTHNQPTRIPYEVPDTPRCVCLLVLCVILTLPLLGAGSPLCPMGRQVGMLQDLAVTYPILASFVHTLKPVHSVTNFCVSFKADAFFNLKVSW